MTEKAEELISLDEAHKILKGHVGIHSDEQDHETTTPGVKPTAVPFNHPKCNGCYNLNREAADLAFCKVGQQPTVCGDGGDPETGYAPLIPDAEAYADWKSKHGFHFVNQPHTATPPKSMTQKVAFRTVDINPGGGNSASKGGLFVDLAKWSGGGAPVSPSTKPQKITGTVSADHSPVYKRIREKMSENPNHPDAKAKARKAGGGKIFGMDKLSQLTGSPAKHIRDLAVNSHHSSHFVEQARSKYGEKIKHLSDGQLRSAYHSTGILHSQRDGDLEKGRGKTTLDVSLGNDGGLTGLTCAKSSKMAQMPEGLRRISGSDSLYNKKSARYSSKVFHYKIQPTTRGYATHIIDRATSGTTVERSKTFEQAHNIAVNHHRMHSAKFPSQHFKKTLMPSGGDDSERIQKALDACEPNGTVRLGPGVFHVHDVIFLDGKKVIIGNGTVVKSAPPGWSEETMHKLKRKHGVESAFKIAWAAYKKKHGNKKVHFKKGEDMNDLEKGSKLKWSKNPSSSAPLHARPSTASTPHGKYSLYSGGSHGSSVYYTPSTRPGARSKHERTGEHMQWHGPSAVSDAESHHAMKISSMKWHPKNYKKSEEDQDLMKCSHKQHDANCPHCKKKRMEEMKKSLTIEKALALREGGKGKKRAIGYTSTGKPIMADTDVSDPYHAGFTDEEHDEASELHHDIADRLSQAANRYSNGVTPGSPGLPVSARKYINEAAQHHRSMGYGHGRKASDKRKSKYPATVEGPAEHPSFAETKKSEESHALSGITPPTAVLHR